jgi:hypothetical protein
MDGWIDGLRDAWRFLIRKALLSLWLRLAKLLIMYQIKKSYHVSSQIKYWCHSGYISLYFIIQPAFFSCFQNIFHKTRKNKIFFSPFHEHVKKYTKYTILSSNNKTSYFIPTIWKILIIWIPGYYLYECIFERNMMYYLHIHVWSKPLTKYANTIFYNTTDKL